MSDPLTRERYRLIEGVKAGDGKFDLDAWHAMETRDNALIEQEIMHGMASAKFVYHFDIQGTTVSGISVVGARHLASHYGGLQHKLIGSMHKTGKLFTFTSYPQVGIPMNVQCALIPELEQEEDFFGAVIELHDIKNGNTIQIEKRESRYGYTRDRKQYEKPHYPAIAQAKAFRNGVLSLVAQDLQLKWKVEMLKLAKDEEIGPDVFAEKRAGILRYAAAKSVPLDRRAMEGLTLDQIAGLSDAVREDKVEGFKGAAEALGILARLGVTQGAQGAQVEQQQPRAASTAGAGAPAASRVQTQPETATPAQASQVATAQNGFEAILMGPDGQPVDGEVITDPVRFARAVTNMVAKDDDGQLAIFEHNADGIADAKEASPEVAKIIDGFIRSQQRKQVQDAATSTYTGADLEQPVVIPVVRGKMSWSGWVANVKEALPKVDGPSFLPFLEANRKSLENALFAYRLQALRAIHNRSVALGISLPTWAPGLTDDSPAASDPAPSNEAAKSDMPEATGDQQREEPTDDQRNAAGAALAQAVALPSDPPAQDGKSDRDATWEQDVLGALAAAESVNEVAMLGRYQSTQTVMARLKREQPLRWKRVFDAFDARTAELKAGKEQDDVTSPGQE